MQKSNSAEAQKGFKDSRIQGFECNAPDTEDSAEAGGEGSSAEVQKSKRAEVRRAKGLSFTFC
ncbi:MAG: hypothetical protein MUO31_10475 [Thermodesulfovibrionales bacterium]|nr:hypothetical protein [Thermodesulfovibrionales bacterium]